MQAQLEQLIEADLGRPVLDRDLSGHIHEGPEISPRTVRWLRRKLLPGCRLKETLVAEGKSDGISRSELDQAKDALCVRVEPCGYGADYEWIVLGDGTRKRGKKLPDRIFWSLPE